MQGLKEIAVEQNENRTEKLGTAEKEIDLFEHQIDLPLEWRVPRDLSLDNVIGEIHRDVPNQKFTEFVVRTHGFCVTD